MKPLTLLSLALIPACAVGPKYVSPDSPTPPSFKSNAGGALAAPPDEAALQSWWQRFGDSKLNDLIAKSIASNLDVKTAVANIKAARAQRSVTRFDYAPIVTSNSSYATSRATAGSVPPGVNRDNDNFSSSFDATWELDLFGHVRRNVEAASADLAAAEAGRDDLLVSVTAETGRSYMELCGLQNQLAVAQRNAQNQQATLDLTKKLMDGGRGTDLDIARAQAQLNTTEATIPPLEGAIDKTLHRLAVLTGQTPDSLRGRLHAGGLPDRLPTIKLGDPASLLRRRADIRAAERQLAAATARVGVATAELFPIVSVNGGIGLSADTFSGLGRSGADHFSFGPAIHWAFLDSPRRLQLAKAAGARAEAKLSTYQQTVLLALEDVENSVTDYGREQTRRASLAQAVEASAKAATLASQRYDQGTAGFLEVLDAERVKLQAEAALAASQTQTATNLIAVFKALGGGWQK